MNDPSLDGYYGRKHDSVLKLSMLFCVNRSGKQLVDEIDLRMALTSLNENERYLPNVMRNIQSNMIGEERNKVLRAVNRKGKLPYAKLLRSLSYCMNAQRLNEILMGLVAEGVVKETIVDGKRIFKGGE